MSLENPLTQGGMKCAFSDLPVPGLIWYIIDPRQNLLDESLIGMLDGLLQAPGGSTHPRVSK